MKFNDDFSEDEDEPMDKDEVMKLHQQQVEKVFFDTLDSGNDISIFLYMPMELLSDKVKLQLDAYLYEHAYEKIFIENLDEVFSNENISVVPKTPTAKIKILEDMLKYYLEKEEYEKCVQIRDEIKIENQKII